MPVATRASRTTPDDAPEISGTGSNNKRSTTRSRFEPNNVRPLLLSLHGHWGACGNPRDIAVLKEAKLIGAGSAGHSERQRAATTDIHEAQIGAVWNAGLIEAYTVGRVPRRILHAHIDNRSRRYA